MLHSMTRVTQKVTSIIKVGGLKEEKEPFDFQFVFLGSSLSLEWQTTSCTSFPSLPYPEDFRSNAGHRSKSYINCLTSFNIDLLCMLSCFSCVQLFESRPQWTVAPPRGLSPHPVDCFPPGSFVHEDSPGKNTGVDCHAFLQGIFPTQGSNPRLLHCRRLLYC